MLTLPLEPTDDRADPAFKDAAGCRLWLSQLQLTNLQQAHSKLLDQINELNRYPMRGLERFETLELLHETVHHIQEDYAKKLTGKPLPLNANEMAVFRSIIQLWQAMVLGYQRGLQAFIAGEKTLANHGALFCQRCLHYSGQEILEHLRTGYEFSPQLWHQLHQLYAYAEQRKLHLIDVADALSDQSTSCANSYTRMLLTCYANPSQMTRRQLQQTTRWLITWCNEISLERSCQVSKNDSKPLAVDLTSTQGLQRIEGLPRNEAIRYLATMPLSKLLRVKIILLQQGQTPQQTGLGDQLDNTACLELLTMLLQCWCDDQHKRLNKRRPKSLHAELCFKAERIYAHLFGKSFMPNDGNLDNLALKQIATLGHVLQAERERVETTHPLEKWRMEDENITGARLTRCADTGERLNSKQLLALRHLSQREDDRQFFTLATTAWVSVSHAGELQAGVKYLLGLPAPVSICSTGINPDRPKAPAFLLPALPVIKTPASLVIPRGWFQPKRVIEVHQQDGKILMVELGFSVEAGIDFERVSFSVAEDAKSHNSKRR